ncbi:MAG TPA: chemotaxis protein CheW [Ktedonobacteraceae bacterium]|nr:chemotaxis protein CheW [Ktedonobacteraceae bacterium]
MEDHTNAIPQSLELMSDEAFWDYAHERASSISSIPADERVRSQQYLECRLSCGTFLIPLDALCEVMAAPRHFALLPDIPSWMLGITVWRGQTIAVLDLNAYLCDIPSQTGIDSSQGTLLVSNDARQGDLSVGLFVHLSGMIHNQIYDEQALPSSPIIDMSLLLADVVRQIGSAAYHG